MISEDYDDIELLLMLIQANQHINRAIQLLAEDDMLAHLSAPNADAFFVDYYEAKIDLRKAIALTKDVLTELPRAKPQKRLDKQDITT